MSAAVPNPFMTGVLAALLQSPVANSQSDNYLRQILARESVFRGLLSPVSQATSVLTPIIADWGRPYVSFVAPSGSFAKGTANRSSCDLDLLISLYSSCNVSLAAICTSLRDSLRLAGLPATIQNASVGTKVGGLDVDLVPARQRSSWSNEHSIYNKRTGTWRKTNVQSHVQFVSTSGCLDEIRLLKLWRNQLRLDFPSFLLELVVIRALTGDWYGTLSSRFLKVLDFIAAEIADVQVIDPANPSNIISNDLTFAEKARIRAAARRSLTSRWADIIH